MLSQNRDVVATRVFAKFREHEKKEKDAAVSKIREVRNLAAATLERDDKSMAAPSTGRMRSGTATASSGVGFRKKHPEQFLKTYSHDYDDTEGLVRFSATGSKLVSLQRSLTHFPPIYFSLFRKTHSAPTGRAAS